VKRYKFKISKITKSAGKEKQEGSGQPLYLVNKPSSLNYDTAEPLLMRHLMPIARDSSEIRTYATSMIDISDGLLIDLNRICDESGVGAKIYLERIPISREMKDASSILGLDALHLALSGGEDYELLFTAGHDCDVPNHVKTVCIGEITAKERVIVDKEGSAYPLKTEGYQHFAV
ncbi:MAG: AIR synthase-related protein, partial [Nitrospirae bacterium]|nr:AIR synthase-related protein [Nitrospirota bacterium]